MTQEEMSDFIFNLLTWAKILIVILVVWALVEIFT